MQRHRRAGESRTFPTSVEGIQRVDDATTAAAGGGSEVFEGVLPLMVHG